MTLNFGDTTVPTVRRRIRLIVQVFAKISTMVLAVRFFARCPMPKMSRGFVTRRRVVSSIIMSRIQEASLLVCASTMEV